MKLRSSWPAVASTMRSIRGRGKLSLGHAWLMSVKSMQNRHLSFAFLTSTTLGLLLLSPLRESFKLGWRRYPEGLGV